jgi:hypothetical protein
VARAELNEEVLLNSVHRQQQQQQRSALALPAPPVPTTSTATTAGGAMPTSERRQLLYRAETAEFRLVSPVHIYIYIYMQYNYT